MISDPTGDLFQSTLNEMTSFVFRGHMNMKACQQFKNTCRLCYTVANSEEKNENTQSFESETEQQQLAGDPR